MYVRYHARSHEGKFLPESRLVVLIVPAVIGPCGLLLFGFGAERTWHWAILYVGCGMISVVPAAAIVAMTYTVDSYFEVAAEALLVINGLKAVAAWGFTYGFIPWTEKVGYATVSLDVHFASSKVLTIIRRSEPWPGFGGSPSCWLCLFTSGVRE